MRNNSMMIMFLFISMFVGSTLLAQCKSSVATTAKRPVDERKVALNFCVHSRCNYFNPEYDDRREYCHSTIDECRANCASCQPKCLP
ncbi:unnamed protein product [Urochloa decumbens]|uniref:Uncharacterized protein n=1 Tax=Urochloa decumbens TaxID=240449 RepID=A0ABC8ZTA0_9POAL